MSEFLVTGFEDEQGAILLTTLKGRVPNGKKMC
jgi:tRNA-binding protein